MPCPHHDIKIIQRSNHQSAVASAAYQSGERLFSEYDQKQKYYSHKSEIVHTEIMLPPHAPPAYADRNTLWNAAEAIEKQWNSQLARRIVLAIPRGNPPEQHADLIRDYCREFFVSKGMIADFAIHDKGNGNPHAHILLTMRAMDENGKWLPKSRKVYDLDENGERIRLPSGSWKSHKEDTVDWNDQKYGEIWRQGWAATANRYLEANGRPERLDLRSYERQGLDKIPTVHMGPAVSQMEKRGIQTNIGNLNRDIKAANSLMQSIRQMVRHLKGWIADLKEKKSRPAGSLAGIEGTHPAGAAGEISGFAPGGTYRLDKQRPAYRQRCRFQQGYGSYPLSAGKGAVHCAEFGRLSGYRQRAGRFHPGRDEAERTAYERNQHPAFPYRQL